MITPTFIYEESIESTNNYLEDLIENTDYKEGSVVYCDKQIAGRGQGENKWESNPFENITCSLLLKPIFLKASEQFYLNKAICISICQVVEKYTLDENVKIKWPNDIYVNDKKIAGILIEHSVIGSSLYTTIAGIGLNVNQILFKNAPNPISLRMIKNENHNCFNILEELTKTILSNYELLKLNIFHFDEAYKNKLFRINQWNEYTINNIKSIGKIIDVNSLGQLILELENGNQMKCSFKEVSYII